MTPDITIGILTRDAGDLFPRLLAAVAAQRDPRPRELLVLDSGSRDETVAHAQRHGARIERMALDPFDFGVARDRLFELAHGVIVVCLSQDAVPAHDRWLENLTAPLDEGCVAASGRSLPDPDRAYRQFAWEANGFFYFTREMRRFRERWGKGFSFANAAVLRDAWQRQRIAPQTLGEDFQLQTKWVEAGHEIAFPDGAEVLHHHQYSLRSLRARCRNEGLAAKQLGIPYAARDCAADLLSASAWRRLVHDAVRGRLRTPAEWLFPIVRPMAVYSGSRWGTALRPYRVDGRENS